MSRVPNPYFAGPPATQPDTFFGREDVLNFVDDTLASPMQNVIVFYGQRRIGKTSILHQIARRSGEDYQAVFFDLQSSVDRSAPDLLYGLAREVAGQTNMPPPDRAMFQTDPDAFRALFLPQVYASLHDKRLLLLLDEFDALSLESSPAELDALPFVQALNRIIQSDDKRVIFLFVVGRRLKDLSAQQLQIFRGARDRQITLLDKESTVQLITRPAQDILTYHEAAVERIWALTSGHPYFTQLICHEIFNRAQHQNTQFITEAHVDAVIDDAVSSGQSALQWFWNEVPPVERFTLYTIGQLTAEWEGATLDQLITQRNVYGVQVPDFELRALPDQLVDRQVLKRDANDRYGLAVELVRRWIVRSHSLEEVTTELTRTAAADEPAKTFFNAGLAAYRADDIDLAIENFSRALSINPDYVEARLWLARSRAKAGDLLVAIDEFAYVERFGGRESREARIRLADARAQYGQRLEQEDKIEEAVQEYQRVLELDPQHVEANARLSQIYRRQAAKHLAEKGVDAAQPLYEQALQHSVDAEQDRQHIKEHLDHYSQAQEAANNWEEAERASRLAAQLMSITDESQEALLRVQLGRGHWHLGQHQLEAAAGVYRRVLEEFPGDPTRQMIENDILRYSQHQEEQNQWGQAEAALALLVELFPNDLEHRSRLVDNLCRQAEFFLDQDDLAKARTIYRRALAEESLHDTVRNSVKAGFQAYRQARAGQRTVQARKLVEEAMLVLTEILGQHDILAYQWLAEARAGLGDALRAEGRLAEARTAYERAIDDATPVLQFADQLDQAYRQRAAIWLKLGQIELDEARFDQAMEHFRQVLVDVRSDRVLVDQLKTTLNAYRRQQEELLRWNQAERALEMLDRLIPNDEETQFWLAETRTAHANWHLRRALPELDAARRLARSALLDVSLSYANREVIAASLKESFQSYRLRQEEATPPNWTHAEQSMNSLVSLLPDDGEVHRWLAQTRINQAEWYLTHKHQSPVEARRYLLKAAEVCHRALNDLPGDEVLVAHFKQSFRAYQQRQKAAEPPAWSLAEQAMQILTELLPQDGEIRQWLAETFLEQGAWLLQRRPTGLAEAKTHLAEAKQAYENALQVPLADKSILEAPIQAHFSRYRQQRTQAAPPQWELAGEAMTILASLLPEATETRQQQAELYAAQGDWLLQQEPVDLERVEQAYRRALKELPGPLEVLAARLQENFKAYRLKQQQATPPNWQAAEQAMAVLAALLPDDDETRWQLAELYAEQGHRCLKREAIDPATAEAALTEAEQYYRQALAALSGDKSALIAQIREDFNNYHLKQIQAEPPRWHLAEKAIGVLAGLPFEDDEATRRLAEVQAGWARACLQSEADRPDEAEQNLARAEEIYRRAATELPAEKTLLFSFMKEDLNAYRLRHEQARPPRWGLAERALLLLNEFLVDDEETQGWLVETYLAQGQYYEAEAQSIGGWRRETQQLEKLDEAEEIYRRAATTAERRTGLAPDNPAAWQQLATTLTHLGRLCRLSEDEQAALAAYDKALTSWQKVKDLGADAPFQQAIADTYIARGDVRLQRGDLMAAGQDYVIASKLTAADRTWLGEVDRQLQVYQSRQKSMGIQKQVVAAEELRYQLQPDNPAVRRELAAELVAYGSQFLEDDEFELARQRYEQAMRPHPQASDLDEDERRRLSRIIVQDVARFIQRHERANNRRQADEARAWLASAGFLADEAVVPSRPRRRWPRWGPVTVGAVLLLCVIAGGGLALGREGPLGFVVAAVFPPVETPPASATPVALATPTTGVVSSPASPTSTHTSMPTATPVPPTSTPSPTATPSPSPTITATPTGMPTPTPTPTPTDTPTPTPEPVLQILGPASGTVFQGASPRPRLEWEPVVDLAPDEYYLVRLRFVEDGQPARFSWRLRSTGWEVPVEFFYRADPPEREIEWEVVLVQIPTGSDNSDAIELSAPSEARTFTWERIPLPGGAGLDVAINPQEPLQVLVILKGIGIYKSDNGGIDWRKVSNERTLESLHIAPANPALVYAGAFNQIFKSENQGETWRPFSIPPQVQVHDIATDPDDANIVFVATERGILRSGDGGQSWQTLDRAGGTNGQVLNSPFYSLLAVKTPQGNRIYAVGESDQIYWRGTNDTGSPWQTQVCEVCRPPIFALTGDPQNKDKLLVGSDKGVIALSLNAGADWTRATIPSLIPTLKFSVLAVNPVDRDIIYAGSGSNRNPFDGEGLYQSLDGGQTWRRFNNWASGQGGGTYIQGIALNEEVIFIAGSEGVFRSDDKGDNWTKQ